MHHPSPMSSELGFMPTMYSFSDLTSLPEMGIDFGPPSTSDQQQRGALATSWEKRCLRKHRRRADDEGCSAKRRRLMVEMTSDLLDQTSCPAACHDWPPPVRGRAPPGPVQPPPSSRAHPPPRPGSRDALASPAASSSAATPRPETDGSCMEVEAAQRRLREIEDRITLEDDEDDEDLDVEPAPRRPVLVLSASLKEGLQRGIGDILPHTVAQSVSHSCMELVVWRPPEDALSRRLKDSLQRQRNKQQQTASRQGTPCPSPGGPRGSPSPTTPRYSPPETHSSGEEDMEL